METFMLVDKKDLDKIINDKIAEVVLEGFVNKFENVLIPAEWVAIIHNISVKTVYNYVKDGILEPEFREKNYCDYRFRLSDILKIDIKELKKQVRLRNQIIKRQTNPT